jgi:hypothetical protein
VTRRTRRSRAWSGPTAPAPPAGNGVFRVRTRFTFKVALLVLVALGLFGLPGLLMLGEAVTGGTGPEQSTGERLWLLGLVLTTMGVGGGAIWVGQALSRRPVLELHDHQVVLPTAWPRPRRGDRTLPWDQVAWLAAFTQVIRSRGMVAARHHYLAFVPAAWAAAAAPASGLERFGAGLARAPSGEAVRYSLWVRPGLSAGLEEIVEQARRRKPGLCFVDRREHSPRRLRRLRAFLTGRAAAASSDR